MGPARAARDGRDSIDQGECLGEVVDVRGSGDDLERGLMFVADQVVLAVRLPLVDLSRNNQANRSVKWCCQSHHGSRRWATKDHRSSSASLPRGQPRKRSRDRRSTVRCRRATWARAMTPWRRTSGFSASNALPTRGRIASASAWLRASAITATPTSGSPRLNAASTSSGRSIQRSVEPSCQFRKGAGCPGAAELRCFRSIEAGKGSVPCRNGTKNSVRRARAARFRHDKRSGF